MDSRRSSAPAAAPLQETDRSADFWPHLTLILTCLSRACGVTRGGLYIIIIICCCCRGERRVHMQDYFNLKTIDLLSLYCYSFISPVGCVISISILLACCAATTLIPLRFLRQKRGRRVDVTWPVCATVI
ncbi:Hypothetical predicted protein [Xyrichtys novacula]|uniref:Uncharacterized protein n=1 Tax=Xyrichtys novacula TaxID=13765 RepID=A0AAV1GLF9_XYRNO|nr:Hypothetical predicted protein [Xyrichtys novacula]